MGSHGRQHAIINIIDIIDIIDIPSLISKTTLGRPWRDSGGPGEILVALGMFWWPLGMFWWPWRDSGGPGDVLVAPGDVLVALEMFWRGSRALKDKTEP
ncbi:hypothetical protein DUI87_33204 [Hirundo rustica rustica]|uniref:Uncharacterized protein n=1 Tax=Hirundo rustica rustica TaxID=333673 RepID=A0A3M0IPM1_HIRRU|nr:hypothetical protein DUI87_33204 [Hirundo rustica rustica]